MSAVPSLAAPPENTRFAVAIEGRAASVRPDEWNALARRGFSLHRWHAAAEASGWRARHVVVRERGAIRAIVPAYLLDGGAALDIHDRWLGPLGPAMAAMGLRLRPTISVGAPGSTTSDWLGDLDGLPDVILAQVLAALEDQARLDGARAVVWPFVDQDRTRLREMARQAGYLDVYAGSSARLGIEWPSFDEYVSSRSKSLRRTIRGELRSLADQGIRTAITDDFRVHAGAMASVYRGSNGRHRGRTPAVPDALFEQLARVPTPGLWGQLAFVGDHLVASSVSVVAGGIMEGTLAAFTPEFLGGPVYHNDLVYEPLRLACSHGVGALDLGPTALYPKVLRGARLRRRRTLALGVSGPVHAALRTLGPLVARRTEWKERRALAPLGALESLIIA
ncbi:MAG TPA: GNAT family N-acetyltransferase [Gemmatimonadales bacterium]|jgi:predicted N-acyltransferase